jgi:hypothetical protein
VPAGDLITTDWQIEYNDLLTGDLTDIDILSIEGLEDLPPQRGSDYPLAEYDGSAPGRRFSEPRVITVTYELAGEPGDLRTLVNSLRRATGTRSDELPLVIAVPGMDVLRLNARPTWRRLPINLAFFFGIPQAIIEFTATDPVLYSNTLRSTAVGVFEPGGGGVSFPVSFPKDFGGASAGGTVLVENDGDWPTWPRFVITGPPSGAVNIQAIENITDGVEITTTSDGGLTISSGRTLVIETHPARRTVAFTDGASRWNTVAGNEWWPIQPGGAQLRLRGTGDVDGVVCTVETRDAFL